MPTYELILWILIIVWYIFTVYVNNTNLIIWWFHVLYRYHRNLLKWEKMTNIKYFSRTMHNLMDRKTFCAKKVFKFTTNVDSWYCICNIQNDLKAIILCISLIQNIDSNFRSFFLYISNHFCGGISLQCFDSLCNALFIDDSQAYY